MVSGQDVPFLGVWTNTVNQGRVTVNVTMDFRSNGVVIVTATAPSYTSGCSSYTGKYEVVDNDIVFYGESGHGFGPHQVERHTTTNRFIYSSAKDLLANKGDDNFRHPLARLNTTASNQVSEAIGASAPQPQHWR